VVAQPASSSASNIAGKIGNMGKGSSSNSEGVVLTSGMRPTAICTHPSSKARFKCSVEICASSTQRKSEPGKGGIRPVEASGAIQRQFNTCKTASKIRAATLEAMNTFGAFQDTGARVLCGLMEQSHYQILCPSELDFVE
jgi:hypothetical protein